MIYPRSCFVNPSILPTRPGLLHPMGITQAHRRHPLSELLDVNIEYEISHALVAEVHGSIEDPLDAPADDTVAGVVDIGDIAQAATLRVAAMLAPHRQPAAPDLVCDVGQRYLALHLYKICSGRPLEVAILAEDALDVGWEQNIGIERQLDDLLD